MSREEVTVREIGRKGGTVIREERGRGKEGERRLICEQADRIRHAQEISGLRELLDVLLLPPLLSPCNAPAGDSAAELCV